MRATRENVTRKGERRREAVRFFLTWTGGSDSRGKPRHSRRKRDHRTAMTCERMAWHPARDDTPPPSPDRRRRRQRKRGSTRRTKLRGEMEMDRMVGFRRDRRRQKRRRVVTSLINIPYFENPCTINTFAGSEAIGIVEA